MKGAYNILNVLTNIPRMKQQKEDSEKRSI